MTGTNHLIRHQRPSQNTISARLAISVTTACLCLVGYTGCTSTAGNNASAIRNYQSGNYQQAIQSFQSSLASNPNDANTYYNLAATYYAMGKQRGDQSLLSQAEGLYHQCLDLSPDHTDCHRGLAALLVDTNRSESAFTLLRRWSERSPQIANPRVELARLYEEFGDRTSARRHLTDAIQIDQRHPRAWTALANLREHEGQLAQALSDYQQAYSLNGGQPEIANRIASLQQRIATGGSSPTGGNQRY